jgi:hypothetical protein
LHGFPALDIALVALIRQPIEAEPFASRALDAYGFAAAVLARSDPAGERFSEMTAS